MQSSNYLLRYTVFLFAAVRLRTTHTSTAQRARCAKMLTA